MLNITRGVPFDAALAIEGDTDTLERCELLLVQGGRTILRKDTAEALSDGERACLRFSGTETARLKSGEAAYAQLRFTLTGGETLYSETEELTVIDLPGGEERAWN